MHGLQNVKLWLKLFESCYFLIFVFFTNIAEFLCWSFDWIVFYGTDRLRDINCLSVGISCECGYFWCCDAGVYFTTLRANFVTILKLCCYVVLYADGHFY